MFDQDRDDECDRSLASLCGVLHATTFRILEAIAQVLSTDAWHVEGSSPRCTG